MARYFYAWIPFVALSGVLFLVIPFLGLIAAAVFAAGAVAALGLVVWRIVAALGELVRFVLTHRPRHIRGARMPAARPAAQARAAVAHRP